VKEKMLWNIYKTASVKASKIREITLSTVPDHRGKFWWCVKGWFNKDEYFSFGDFDSEEEARGFIEELHRQIESE